MDEVAVDRVRTTDHGEIRDWVVRHAGRPSVEAGTQGDGDIGRLRIDFAGRRPAAHLRPVGWDPWFAKFEAQGLALVYEPHAAVGTADTFCMFIKR
jgi:hypothetical protein